jgi:hypothetical protein
MSATVATAGRSPRTQSLLRANSRSKPKRMAVSLERYVLTVFSYSSVVLSIRMEARLASPGSEELILGSIGYP